MTIGERAYKEVKKVAEEEGISFTLECLNLGTCHTAAANWRKKNRTPSAHTLRQMALMGYDVIYILTGVSKDED
jgi:hypothetical protein